MYERPFRVLVKDRERNSRTSLSTHRHIDYRHRWCWVYTTRLSRYRTHAFEPANSLGPHDSPAVGRRLPPACFPACLSSPAAAPSPAFGSPTSIWATTFFVFPSLFFRDTFTEIPIPIFLVQENKIANELYEKSFMEVRDMKRHQHDKIIFFNALPAWSYRT